MTGQGDASARALAATLHEFLARTGALRASALVDRGEDVPALLLECDAAGETLADDEPLDAAGATPLELPGDLRSLPPPVFDAEHAELQAPPGVVAAMAEWVQGLGELLEGRSVVTVEWASADSELGLVIAARRGEPLLLALGDEQFEMPAGWP